MNLPMHLPLNALRAFEASARHLSFTQAGMELCVSQAAVSAQVKNLEMRLGVALFRRLPRGLVLTDEGLALLPTLSDAFARLTGALSHFDKGRIRETVTVACVATFAVGWLLPRLPDFRREHPYLDIRLLTNNNAMNLAADALDFAIRFGDGAWRGVDAHALVAAPLSPLCSAAVARRLRAPSDLLGETLLRSYRANEWPSWFALASEPVPVLHGPVFDSSHAMASAAAQDLGVALLPVAMFGPDLAQRRLVQPFGIELSLGQYWLTWQKSKPLTPSMQAFRLWAVDAAQAAAR